MIFVNTLKLYFYHGWVSKYAKHIISEFNESGKKLNILQNGEKKERNRESRKINW